jgi:hypothetical protein
MDHLPEWITSIIAIAVGLCPGLAFLSARSIARLIHRVPWPETPRAGQRERKPACEGSVGVSG